jgi:hypothetical protein
LGGGEQNPIQKNYPERSEASPPPTKRKNIHHRIHLTVPNSALRIAPLPFLNFFIPSPRLRVSAVKKPHPPVAVRKDRKS